MQENLNICADSLPKNVEKYTETFIKLSENDKNYFVLDMLFNDMMSKLPEFLRPRDLIKLGLFRSSSDLSWAMKRNQSPPFIRLSVKKIVFSRIFLCEWLKQKTISDELKKGVENARP